MKRLTSLSAPLLSLVVFACGGSPPAESPAPPPETAPLSTAAPAPAEAKAEPTPEEKKKAEALAELEKDRATMKAEHEAALARWTPELKKEAQALADKSFATGKDAIKAAAASKARKPGNADRDKYRHPVETLEFFGLKPTMTVLEYGPGEGWYTELLAPALAKKGKLLVTNGDPNGPVEERSTFYAERVKLFLESSPELYGKVETVTIDSKAPKIAGKDGQLDMAIVMRSLHGMVNAGKLDEWLAAIHTSLKPNGVLGIEQHRANADAKVEESAKKGYLPEKWVIERVEAAGFKLAGKSEINANPKDTKDYADGVWALPPTLKGADKDKERLTAIGESDRMTLKFTKVAAKAAPAAGAKPAAPPAPAAEKK
ncbi:MAG: class I SAM-dependent methyltransferase [Labilithrix sp.]|nr:class I SAM-dependent methyltransferase [Labilithrix sp.]MCW5834498.1 class I SAM-dependent methyltransferase [Labilithrix sp.]